MYHCVYTKDYQGDHPKWDFNGDMDKPTFSPSLLVNFDNWDPPVNPENLAQWHENPWQQKRVKHVCHSYVRDGVWQFLDDCTHELAGQNVPMLDVDL